MKYENVFGERVYELAYDFKLFVVSQNRGTGKWQIKKHEPFYTTDATVFPLWDKAPEFDSYIQAVRWLKANYKDLI